uniref:EF-hand domain-containing protein n=1 Tax=Oncorhynchus mykiss TaxID=8022 RepID=A0A8C7LY17_ONCMY
MFLNTTCPGAVTIRVFHGKANDPDIARSLVHGVSSQASISVMINPPPKTIYQQRLHQLHEAGYSTNQKAPLGRSHDQSPGLPNWFDTDTSKATFGVKSLKSNVFLLIQLQLETEAQEGHQSYIRSHNAYFVSEYCGHLSLFVMTSNVDLCNAIFSHTHNSAMFVSQRCDDRERIQPQISKVHDPIANTLKVPADEEFGLTFSTDAGDLLHSTPTAEYMKGSDRQRTLVSAVRQHLRKVNFHNFNSLLQAFRHDDKKGLGQGGDQEPDGHSDRGKQPVLDDLMEYCDMDKDGLINFQEFANFLNWKNKMAISKVEQRILTSGQLQYQHAPDNMQREALPVRPASSEALARPEDREPAEVGSMLKNRYLDSAHDFSHLYLNYRMYGTPTVRTNLVAPRIKSVSDSTNYDEVQNTNEPTDESRERKKDMTFAEARKLASMRHPTGDMCVEIFRDVLKEIQAN